MVTPSCDWALVALKTQSQLITVRSPPCVEFCPLWFKIYFLNKPRRGVSNVPSLFVRMQWYIMADSDTTLNVEPLLHLLSSYDEEVPLMIGQLYDNGSHHGYLTGGAGVCARAPSIGATDHHHALYWTSSVSRHKPVFRPCLILARISVLF